MKVKCNNCKAANMALFVKEIMTVMIATTVDGSNTSRYVGT